MIITLAVFYLFNSNAVRSFLYEDEWLFVEESIDTTFDFDFMSLLIFLLLLAFVAGRNLYWSGEVVQALLLEVQGRRPSAAGACQRLQPACS